MEGETLVLAPDGVYIKDRMPKGKDNPLVALLYDAIVVRFEDRVDVNLHEVIEVYLEHCDD